MESLKHYLGGREQAFVKHSLLKTYLEKLFMIIGQRQRTICYVDGFSGPWEENSSDLMDTSIGISLNIMKKCQNSLNDMGHLVRFRALYIEKNKSSYLKLKNFISDIKDIEIATINGEFSKNIMEALQWAGPNDFVFFFIDPKGYVDVIEPQTLAPMLCRNNSEFLINFMYDHLNRFVTADFMKKKMVDIFGEIPQVKDLKPKDREKYLLRLYRNRLKDIMTPLNGTPRFAYASVLDPQKDKTKYEMIYLTRHSLGILKFLEASEKLDIIQKTVRIKAQEHLCQQINLFPTDEIIEFCTNDTVSIEEVKRYWLRNLSTTPQLFGYDRMADMHEETGWLLSDFQRAFLELINENKVENIDMKKPRPKKPIHFDNNYGQGELLRRLP